MSLQTRGCGTGFALAVFIMGMAASVDAQTLLPPEQVLAKMQLANSFFMSNWPDPTAPIVHPDKMNIATLGNVVSQFHVHVIARHVADAAWHQPVWGVGERAPYAADERARVLDLLRAGLALSPDA